MTVSSPPPVPGQAKKLSPLAWVLIGCGTIVFFVALAMGACAYFVKGKIDKFAENPAYAAMKLAVQANPDVEIVSSDDKAGTITVKDKKSGEVVTFNTEDFKSGKISMRTKDGEAKIDFSGGADGGIKVTNEKGEATVQFGGGDVKNLPSWVPSYPGARTQGTLDSTANGARNLAYTVTSGDSVDQLMEFFGSKLEGSGFKVDRSTYTANGATGGSISGKSSDGKRTMTAIVSSADGGGAQALVTIEEKN